MVYEVIIIQNGYSKSVKDGMKANCTCTLIKGKFNIIIDTMTPWDKAVILEGLEKHKVKPEDIHYVVSTHGHSDHCGNNNLFLESTHIVGHGISKRDMYFDTPLTSGKSYPIDGDELKIIPTPGHTLSDISVLVKTSNGLVAIVGDLFEKKEDIEHDYLWVSNSESPALQRFHRNIILERADYIVPGHGEMFQVTDQMRNIARDYI